MAELTLTDLHRPPSRTDAADLRPVSPARHLHEAFATAEVTGARAVRVREVPFLTMVGLRILPGSGGAERVVTRLGARLPAACGSVTTGGDCSVLWFSPDEFLVVSDRDPAELTRSLVVALHGEPGSAVDLSANRTTFELSGPSAREVLEKGCSLDLHPRSFEVGSAYATSLASVPVLLWKTGPETWRVMPRASFADHVGRWLVDAMAEFRVPEPH